MKRAQYRQGYFFIVLCLAVAGVLTLLSLPGSAGAGVLYHNGPLINSRGTASGGAQESVVQSTSLGMENSGWLINRGGGNRVADDFVIRDSVGAEIGAITFFAYQTGSTTASTITGVYYQIWDGPPNDAGSSVVWGNLTTNRLAHTVWSGIYRVWDDELGATNRPIMLVRATPPELSLATGTYWLEWQMTGSLASGPWCPFVTMDGLATTGNALWSDNDADPWDPLTDDTGNGTGPVQGLPFILHSPYVYYIPYYARGVENTYSSLALRNSSGNHAATVAITYYGLNGAVVGTTNKTIPPLGEEAFVVDKGTEGWIRVTSGEPLTGLCWVGAIHGAWPWIMA
ncbi:MAG: hypothetical protein E4H15_03050, partial [Syntrophobacterales bacterium]